ncbi:MAG: VTT domain-containing protein [Candidatus Micrarchaeota archaeon]|nr:VTT domain-containing protein [Candidatus Micrarchaeota archaeon]
MKFAYRLAITLALVTAIVYAIGAVAHFDYLAALQAHGRLGMLLISFVSSSIFFVFSSEAVIVAATKFLPPWDIFIYATIGSALAGVLNYYIGLKGLRLFMEDDSKDEKRAEKWFARWGPGVVFVAPAIPFVGDALTVAAGALEMDFAKFFLYSLAGRAVKIALLVVFGEALLAALGL